MSGLTDAALLYVAALALILGVAFAVVLVDSVLDAWLARRADAALAGCRDPHRRRPARGDDWYAS